MTRYFLSCIVFLIIAFSYRKCRVYDAFINGCKDGIKTSINLLPSIIAIIFGTRIFISSGIIEKIIVILLPIFNFLDFPKELFMITLLKPISASSILPFILDLYKNYGVDSKISFIASIIYSVTDTSVYILSLYLGILNLKNTKYVYILCIFINFIGIIVSILVSNLFFS